MKVLNSYEWIMDGNYARTLPIRLAQCDTVFWLDYPLEVCLAGIEERRGKMRTDMPWVETEPDEEFLDFVKGFPQNVNPEMERLLTQAQGKDINIFKSREMADQYLSDRRKNV